MQTERLLFAPWAESDWLAFKPIATRQPLGTRKSGQVIGRDAVEATNYQRMESCC
jgi:hypothetical protein